MFWSAKRRRATAATENSDDSLVWMSAADPAPSGAGGVFRSIAAGLNGEVSRRFSREATRGWLRRNRRYGAYGAVMLAIAAIDAYGLHRLALALADVLPREVQGEIANAQTPRAFEPSLAAPQAETMARLSLAAAPVVMEAPTLEPVILPKEDGSASPWSSGAQTYKTVCVRLCDGAYFPVSFATSPERFAGDEAVCQSRCAAPARLYAYRNPGETISAMRNREGEAYSALETAYKFQTKRDPSCTCKANPWEKEAQDRHRMYALLDAQKRGRVSDSQKTELARLKSETESRMERSKADYRLAGLGERKTNARKTRVAAKFAARPRAKRVRVAQARREPPGMMGLGATNRRYAWTGSRRSRSVGDLVHRQISGM